MKQTLQSKDATKEFQPTEERTRFLFDTIPHALYECNAEGIITFTNAAYSRITGYSQDELVGMPIQKLMAPGPQKETLASYLKELVEKRPAPTPYRTQNLTKDGQSIDVEVNWAYRCNEHNQVVGFVCILADITHRQRTERTLLEYQRQLKSLASHLTLAAEREKRRIAVQLHDEVGQCLAFCKVKLQLAIESMSDQTTADELSAVCEMLTQSMTLIKNVTYDLSSPVLQELGFEKAVCAWLQDDIESQHDVKTEFLVHGPVSPMDEDLKAILFRSVRELVTNAVKHANPSQIHVHVDRHKECISICVEDDGGGFDPETIEFRSKHGLGLFSIRERLDYLGGCLDLVSLPGQGCKAVLRVPLAHKPD